MGEPGAQGLPGAPGADGTGTMLLLAGLCNPLQAGPGGGIARFIRPGNCGSLGIVLPRTGVLSDWHVWMSLSGPTDSPITLSHRINTVAQQVICSRTGLVTIPCLDTPVSVEAGDLLEPVVTLDNSSDAEDLVVQDLTVTVILAPTPAP